VLENPISLMLDKPREDWTRTDLIHVIEEKQIERIAFHYTGLDGQLKELRLPVVDRKQAELILGEESGWMVLLFSKDWWTCRCRISM